MSQESFNPYAAPHTSHPAPGGSSVVPDRASEETLRKVTKLMLFSEIAYISSWLVVILGRGITFTEVDFSRVLFLVMAILLVAAWFSILTVMFTIKSKMWWGWLFIPFSILGIIAFVVCINDARRFLLQNGYRPGVFGSYPDEDEIAAMASDPNYVPDVSLNRDGTARSLPYPLTLTVGAITLLAIITLTLISIALT